MKTDHTPGECQTIGTVKLDNGEIPGNLQNEVQKLVDNSQLTL